MKGKVHVGLPVIANPLSNESCYPFVKSLENSKQLVCFETLATLEYNA